MKILSPKQLKAVETQTVKVQDIELNSLIERNAQAVLEWLKQRINLPQAHFTIICGIGNNGADGLALARLLYFENAHIQIYLQENNTYSLGNLSQQKALRQVKIPFVTYTSESQLEFPAQTIIIDCIFGFGLEWEIEENWRPIIQQINNSEHTVVSLDMPSGLFCHQSNLDPERIVQSDVTLTYQTPKLSLLLAQNEEFVPNFEILDVGLDRNLINLQDSKFNYVDPSSLYGLLGPRNKFTQKYDFGNLLIIAGSYGKIGAAILSAKAALRTGAGLVTSHLPKCGYSIMQSAFPECMVSVDENETVITKFPSIGKFDCVAIGPGLRTDELTARVFEEFLNSNNFENTQLVLDADAINLLAKNSNLISSLPPKTILTPHAKELERLIGKFEDPYKQIEAIQQFTMEHKLIIVAKAAHTAVYTPDGQIYFNSTGNPGMATAGSGDVLTGIIAAQLAKGFPNEIATILGVYLHGLAGDLARNELGEESLIASDIISHISTAYRNMMS